MDQVALPQLSRPEAVNAPANDVGDGARFRRLPQWATDVAIPLGALVVVSLLMWLKGQDAPLWTDEGISVGIASHRLTDIPDVLRQDGSPPLYYLILHGWMGVFGRSEVATHALSLLFAVLTVPAALWAGWSLFGRRAGWVCAVLAATSPYLGEFSNETRMYTLVALLGLVVTASFLHAFVFRRRRYLPLFAGSLVALMYTHNWGIYVALGAMVALFPVLLVASERRMVLKDAAMAFGGIALLYLPWVPTLLDQAAHTGAPWSERPVVREMVSALGLVLGDPHERVLVAIVLGGLGSLIALARHLRSDDTMAVVGAGVIACVTLGAAWIVAQFEPAWSDRYFAALLGPLLLVTAVVLARGGLHGVIALTLILIMWIQPVGRLTGDSEAAALDEKSSPEPITQILSPHLRPGDVVVAMQMEDVPVLQYYLPRGIRFADATGPVDDARVVDWRDAVDRMRRTTPEQGLLPVIDSAGHGTRLVLVCTGDPYSDRSIPWFELMDRACEEWKVALAEDPRMQRLPIPGLREVTSRSVELFEKTSV